MGPYRGYSTLDHLRAVRNSGLQRVHSDPSHARFIHSVTNRLRRNFRALAESNVEAYNSAGYEYVKMDVYLPILDLPLTPKTISTSLSDVAIIGSFRFERRDYLGVYADLLTSFEGEH